jgi:magnesium-transporting ATPase (P-type)
MIFKKLYLQQSCKYEADDLGSLTKILKSGIKPYEKLTSNKSVHDVEFQSVDSILALMICHNVTPVLEEDGSRVLQGSSPDELTLVKFGEYVGYSLKSRSEDYM